MYDKRFYNHDCELNRRTRKVKRYYFLRVPESMLRHHPTFILPEELDENEGLELKDLMQYQA